MEKLLTRKQAAEYLGISITTLDRARFEREIAYVQYRPNGCVFFTEQALQEYVARAVHRAGPVNTVSRGTYRNPHKKR